jgi:hypothetical protein
MPGFKSISRRSLLIVLATVVVLLAVGGYLFSASRHRPVSQVASSAVKGSHEAEGRSEKAASDRHLPWSERIQQARLKDFRALIAEALQITDEKLRDAVLAQLVAAWVNLDAKDFGKYFASLEVLAADDDAHLRIVMTALKQALTQLTPATAKSDAVMALIERFVKNLAKYDPEEAHRWAKMWLLDDTLDSSLVAVAREFAKRSPAQGRAIIAEITGPLRRMQAQTLVGGVWAETEPLAAMEWAQSLPQPTERAMTMNAVLLSVAQQDPALAASRLKETEQRLASEYETQRKRDLTANNLTEADLANDPELYKEMLAAGTITPPRSPDVELLADAGRVIASKLAETDGMAAAAWAESIEHEFLKMKTITGVAAGLAKTDPAKAVALAQRYGAFDEVLTTAFDSWASVSPEAAAKGTQLVEDSAKRKLALETVIKSWVAEGDPAQAAMYIDELPIAERSDTAQARIVAAMSANAPEAAWARAQTISDPTMRYRAMKSAFAVLATERPEIARNLLASTTMSSRDSERLGEMLTAVDANR